MLKMCTLILLLPLASLAQSPCTQDSCHKTFEVRQNHPQLQGMEIELADGSSMTLADFLESISEESESQSTVIFGGEVPWPATGGNCNKNPKQKGCPSN